jgi:hypothetical protein
LREDVDAEGLSVVATNAKRLAENMARLSALAGYDPGSAGALVAELHAYSHTLRERARERDREEAEPPDDDDYHDRWTEDSDSDTDIEALFSDL